MIMNPTAIKHVVVDGHSLTLESFVAIARYNATVELAPSALEAMKKSRALAEKIAAEVRVAYGITTGFGEFQKVAVPKEMSNQLSTNLILSHCTAAGEPYADEIVRGMMLLRANALCGGVSGVRPILVEMLLEMLNKGVTPVVPQKGSLGSSGDLAPLAHMTLPMLGKGEAMYEGVKMPGAEAMAKAGIKTLDTLVSKEGLGMTNGTCAMTSVGTLALYDWTESEMNRRRLAAIVDVQHSLIQRFERGFLLRGVDIQVTLDSNGFAGEGDITLFGELLHRFFALYADIHLFTQLTLILQPTGKCLQWTEHHSQRVPG